MQPLSSLEQDIPGLDGPDYVALVIEWSDQESDQEDLAGVVMPELLAERSRPVVTGRAIAAGLGALGAIILAAWGIHRLRAA